MQKFWLICIMLTTCCAILCGAVTKQKVIISYQVNNAAEEFTKLPTNLVEARVRMAFPYKGSSVIIDAGRAIKPHKVVLNITKLNAKSPATDAGITTLQVYAGNDSQALTLWQGTKFTCVNSGDTASITITDLPAARFFQIYAPRTAPGYVYGFKRVDQGVEVWADATAAPAQTLPQLPSPKAAATKAPQAIVSCGYQDVPQEDKLLTAPYRGTGGNQRLAWPWNKRVIEFELANRTDLGTITIELEKLVPRPENTIGDDKVQVYVSDDGKQFQAATAETAVVYGMKGSTACAQVTLKGKFAGRYFRIYAPWNKKFYIFGTKSIKKSLKVFDNLQVRVDKFAAPLHASGPFTVILQFSGTQQSAGNVLLTLNNKEVYTRNFNALPDRKELSLTVDPGAFCGVGVLELTVTEKGSRNPLKRLLRFRYNPADKTLQPQNISDFRREERTLRGGMPITFLAAAKTKGKIQYTVPADGYYAIYVTMRGTGKFQLQTPSWTKNIALQLWHPADANQVVTGESFAGAAKLNAKDIITLTALSDNAQISDLVLSPLTPKQIPLYDAPNAGIKPAVILHGDGYSDFFFSEVTKQMLQQRIADAKRNHAYAYDWCIGTSAVNYPSKVATIFGQQRDVKFYREGDKLAAARLQKFLHNDGIPMAILRDSASKHGLRFSVTVRANAYYPGNMNSMNAQFFIDHPELFMTDVTGRRLSKPSYAFPEVRNFYLSIIKEVAAYKPDAIVIEFMRHPPFFGYDAPLVAEYTKRHGKCTPKDYLDEKWQQMIGDIMTAHLREVRQAIDAISPGTQLEINFDWQDYRKHGLDLPAILQAGLVDAISPGFYAIGYQKLFPLASFVEMKARAPRKVLLIPRV